MQTKGLSFAPGKAYMITLVWKDKFEAHEVMYDKYS